MSPYAATKVTHMLDNLWFYSSSQASIMLKRKTHPLLYLYSTPHLDVDYAEKKNKACRTWSYNIINVTVEFTYFFFLINVDILRCSRSLLTENVT